MAVDSTKDGYGWCCLWVVCSCVINDMFWMGKPSGWTEVYFFSHSFWLVVCSLYLLLFPFYGYLIQHFLQIPKYVISYAVYVHLLLGSTSSPYTHFSYRKVYGNIVLIVRYIDENKLHFWHSADCFSFIDKYIFSAMKFNFHSYIPNPVDSTLWDICKRIKIIYCKERNRNVDQYWCPSLQSSAVG